MSRIALLCPGRGSYTEASLGSLPPTDDLVRRAERLRVEYELEPLLSLDGASHFEPARHLKPENASALIYVVSMLDGRERMTRDETVCIAGNSMGWYTALAMGGALSFEDGFRLVQEMAILQAQVGGGGQVLYPVVDERWRRSPERMESVRRIVESDAEVFRSIHLGGYEVLAGSPTGVTRLLRELPAVTLGRTTYPLRLAQHGPYHTPLVRAVSEQARSRLAALGFRRPATTLVDGRGVRFTPWSTDVDALRAYTLGAQVDTPYDFTASVRVALHEHAPDRLVLPGPGNTLGGVCGQILIELGWRGIRSRDDFDALQSSGEPIVESMRR